MQLRFTALSNSMPVLALLCCIAMPLSAQVAAPPAPATAAQLDSLQALDARAAELYAQGRDAEAVPLYFRALDIYENSPGRDDSSVASRLAKLGFLLKGLRRFAEAEPLYVRALKIDEQAQGPEHLDVAVDLNNLASLLEATDRYAEAEPLYRRALSIFEKELDPQHFAEATCLSNLARMLTTAKRYAEAEPLYVRALAIRDHSLAAGHPDVETSVINLANLLDVMQRYAEAVPLYARALAISERGPDVNYAVVAIRLNNLALSLKKIGRYTEAEPLYQRALALLETLRGPDQLDVAVSLSNLGSLLETAGRYNEAEPLYRRALAIRKEKLGPEHPDLADSLSRLAKLLQTTARYAEAEPLFARALEIHENAQVPSNANLVIAISDLAGLLGAVGRHAESNPMYVRALKIQEQMSGGDPVTLATSLDNLALQLLAAGRYAEAEPLFMRSLAVLEKNYGAESPLLARSFNNIGGLLNEIGRDAEAEPLYRRALAIRETAFGSEHPDVANSLNNLAALLGETGRAAEAEPLYQRALAIRETAFGPEHPDVANSLNNLATLLKDGKQYPQAESLFRRALLIFETAYGPNHPDVGSNLSNLAVLLRDDGRYDEAEPLLLRALRIAEVPGRPGSLWTVQHNLMAQYAPTQKSRATPPNPELAIYFGKQAVNTLQGLRSGLKDSEAKTRNAFTSKVENTYKDLADLLIDEGRLNEAQQVLAMLKEAEYHDFIRRDGTADSRTTRADLLTNEQQWQQRYQQIAGQAIKLAEEQRVLKKKRDVPPGLNAADARRVDALEEELKAVDRAFAEAIAEIKTSIAALRGNARDAQMRRSIEINPKGMVGALGPGVVLLHTVMLADHLRLLVTHAETRKAYKINVGEPELNRRINALLVALKDPDIDPRPASAALYDALIRPIEADLAQAKARVLMVSLDGALRYVPLAALFDGEHYLVEKLALSVYTDASRDKIKDTPRANWRIAAMGVSQPLRGFTALPGVPRELAAIVRDAAHPAGALRGQSLLDGAFTAAAFSKLLAAEPAVVHVASHFKFSPGNETDSYLLLGNGAALTLEDFRNNRYSLERVDLLTLSACQTAVGDNNRAAKGSEVESFAVMAQNKGAKSVVASLWSVADDSTAQFMQHFYRLRGQGKVSKAEAMRQTQLAMISGQIKPGGATAPRAARQIVAPIAGGVAAPAYRLNPHAQYAHPFYWAPFILMGNWL